MPWEFAALWSFIAESSCCVGTAARSCKRSLTSRRRNAKLWLGTKTIATCHDLPTFDNTCLQLESSRFVAWIRTSCLFKPIGPLCNVWLLPALQRFASRVGGIGGIGLPLNLTVMRQTDLQ